MYCRTTPVAFILFLLIFGLVSVAPACGQNTGDSGAVAKPGVDEPLVIASGDLLHITVLGAPEFERDVRVADNGRAPLPMIGDVMLGGLGIADAQQLIQKKLVEGGFYVDPQVSVLVKEYSTQGISVLGEVQKPGIYPLLGSRALFDAISAAGGTTNRAGRTATITHRNRLLPPETVELTYSADGTLKSNVDIVPGDTIAVSKAGMVYVVGDVKQPTGIVLENPSLTVLQAISMAQGTNGTAALDKAKVLRKTAQGTQEIAVPLKQILAAKKPDVVLQPEDVLFVPNSVAKGAARRSFEAALQTITGVVIYSRRY